MASAATEPTPPDFETDVIIVGGGPVGLSAALDLDRRGIRSLVIERRPFMDAPNVKCNHVSARTMERFRQLGIAETIRSAGLPADHPHDVAVCTTLSGTELSRIRIPSPTERTKGVRGVDSAWATPEPPHRINQRFMEPLLMEVAGSRPHITLKNESLYQGFTQHAEGVDVMAADLDGRGGFRVRGRFLIGADGGKSAVRKQVGAKFVGDPVLQHVQSTCIRAPKLIEASPISPAWGYYAFNPRRNGHVYAIDGQGTFLVHNHLTIAEAESGDVDRDRSIRDILGVDADFDFEVISKEDWIARRFVADRFRLNRVFLAGDAAHLWVPYAGYGMNAGIADVLNLTWLLAAQLAGWAGHSILDAYEAERLPITEQVSQFAMSHQQKVAREDVPANIEDETPEGDEARAGLGARAYELNVRQFAAEGLNFGYSYDSSPIIAYDGESAPTYSMGSYTESTVPGCRAPHFWIDGESVYDKFGLGYTLLCLGDQRPANPLVVAFAEAAVPLEVVEVPIGTAPAAYRHALVLCRDDQHVVWRGRAAPSHPSDLVAQLSGRVRR